MRIGELAERSGLTAKTLRFYEQAGVLPEPGREKSGYRDYDENAVARLVFVKAAKAAGLTLSEIRQVIAVREQEGAPCGHVVALLDSHAAELDRRIVDLTALRDQVLRLRERSRDLDPSQCSATTVCDIIPGPTAPASSRSAL
jgi:DNA-binding transcriptional MerR regulator